MIDHVISCSQYAAGKRKMAWAFFCAARLIGVNHIIKFNLENITVRLAFLSWNKQQSPQRIYIDILMRMLAGFEIWHGRFCLFNTVSPGGDTKRHANYINFQKWNVFGCVHLLITELGSICYEPGSNYLLQLLAPPRSVGDEQNKTTDKTIDCHL